MIQFMLSSTWTSILSVFNDCIRFLTAGMKDSEYRVLAGLSSTECIFHLHRIREDIYSFAAVGPWSIVA